MLLGECAWRSNFDETEAVKSLLEGEGLIQGYTTTYFMFFSKRPISQATGANMPAACVFSTSMSGMAATATTSSVQAQARAWAWKARRHSRQDRPPHRLEAMSEISALNLEPGDAVGGYTLVSRLGAGAWARYGGCMMMAAMSMR